jgi:transcriptional regulator with XRE-family HTH domain
MQGTPYASVLARNIRAARSRLDINQENLAARMRALGYSAWLRQTVANVEKGRRRVIAEEIFGLAYALGTSMTALMRATPDDVFVAFPSGAAIVSISVYRSATGRNDGMVQWNGDTPVVATMPDPTPGPDGRMPYALGYGPEDYGPIPGDEGYGSEGEQ